jgi:hypothetical protein
MKNAFILIATAASVLALAGCNQMATSSPTPLPIQNGPIIPASSSTPEENYVNVLKDVEKNSGLEMLSVSRAMQDFVNNKDFAAFADFMDKDAAVWGTFAMQIEATYPADPSLQATQSTIITELKNMKAEAIKIRDAVKGRDENAALTETKKRLVVSGLLEQQYKQTNNIILHLNK